MGFKQTPFYYDRNDRAARKDQILGAQDVCPRLGRYLRLLQEAPQTGQFRWVRYPIFIALAFAIWVFVMYLSGKESIVPGWSSTIITIVFLGGVQLFTIGILGEYIGNIFDETKNRPEYIIDEKNQFRLLQLTNTLRLLDYEHA